METVTGRGCDRGVVVWERQFRRVSPDKIQLDLMQPVCPCWYEFLDNDLKACRVLPAVYLRHH